MGQLDMIMRDFIIVLAVLFLSVNLYAGEVDKELHEKCIYPTVMLIGNSPCPLHHKGVGSGVIVKSVEKDKKWHNFVFTVAHNMEETPEHECAAVEGVLEAAYYYEIQVGIYENWSLLKDVESYPCEVLYDNDESDLALLKFISNKKMPVAEIDLELKLYIGNDVCRMGCGLGEPFRIDFGKITSLPGAIGRRNPAMKDTYRISAPTIQGDSGGPVYHDNKLLGLAEAIAAISSGPLSKPSPICHIVYVIPISNFMKCEEIKALLE
jgi:S1-C subfamily serine protease